MTFLVKKLTHRIRRRWKPAPFIAHRILLTGAAGKIGQPVGAELVRRGYWVRAMDRVAAPQIHPCRIGSRETSGISHCWMRP